MSIRTTSAQSGRRVGLTMSHSTRPERKGHCSVSGKPSTPDGDLSNPRRVTRPRFSWIALVCPQYPHKDRTCFFE